MDNKKGFTLIEILAVIIIIGIVALIAIPSITGYLNSSKETTFETYEKSMEDAAKNRIVNCLSSNGDCELPEGNQVLKTTLETLIEEGYIDNMKDTDSENFCDAVFSYVAVKGEDVSDYTYKACLYCGDYATDDDVCNRADGGDGDDPDCGLVTGESTRWTNENRTISVLCSDKTSGCERSAFSKTFNFTTNKLYPEDAKGVATITIRDNSGKARQCKVNAYVDKTLPTCKVDAEGEYIESVGWYSLEALAILKDTKDDDSGLLTYGMGTSVKNRDYNKLTQMTFNRGITTAVGYVKDVAGNENICTKEIRIGTEVPKFNLYYGYQIFPDKEPYLLNEITENGTILTTTTDNPRITISNLSKYKGVEKVKITLNSAIVSETIATIKTGSIVRTAPVTTGHTDIIFVIPNGSYDSIEITLGAKNNIQYNINKIELFAKDGSTWTNKDIRLYVEPVDAGMQTTQVSFLNGQNGSWGTTYNKLYDSVTTNKVVTKNAIDMHSLPVTFTTHIDKVMPTITVTAKRISNNATVPEGAYTNEGLKFVFNKVTVGESGSKIYYCKDTTNTCEPNIEINENVELMDFSTITTDYYLRYKTVSSAYDQSDINVYNAKFDTVKPVCTFGNAPAVYVNRESNIELTCTDDRSGVENKEIGVDSFSKSNNNFNIISVTKSVVTNGIKYTIKVKGVNHGTVDLTLNANKVGDLAGNKNDSVSTNNVQVSGVFTISLNNQSATSAGTTSVYELYTIGWYSNSTASTAITSITRPARNGYIFDGYYTNTNGVGTKIINADGTFVSNSFNNFLSDTTIYAKWIECGNGAWCANNVKTTCPAGTYGNGTTTAGTQAAGCANCGNGAWCTGGTARSTCPAGTYGNGTTTATSQSAACQNCGNGAWCTGGTARSTCPAGTYGNGTTTATSQSAACQNCGNGAWCTGGTARRTCPAGTYGNGATTAGSQAAACATCPANNYCTGGTSITGCGSGKSSRSGATAASSCFTTTYNYGYTGGVQSFTAPATGTYKLEVWGAQGGCGNSGCGGGYGGYSIGYKALNAGTVLYIGVGGAGGRSGGGWNGGGSGTIRAGSVTNAGGGGGGATHIAMNNNRGALSGYNGARGEVLIVAGGGGGSSESGDSGGSGGGTNGGRGSGGRYIGGGGTQTGGGSRGDTDTSYPGFGYGGNSAWGNDTPATWGSGGGGGGWFGGGASSHSSGGGIDVDSGGGGGSGYIGGVSSAATYNGYQSGNGYARVTWYSE